MRATAAHEPLALIRRLYDAWNSGDVATAAEVLAPDVRWDTFGAAKANSMQQTLAGEHAGPVVTSDEFYDDDLGRQEAWAGAGALAVEMECFALFDVAARRGAAAAALLLVSDLVLPERERIGADELRAGEERLGRAALAALEVS